MLVFEGRPVYGGVAKGKIHIYAKSENRVRKITIEDCENEIKRFHEALSLASGELDLLHKTVFSEIDGKDADIIEAQRLMSEDEYYSDNVENYIRTQKVNAEYAVLLFLKDFEDKHSGEDEFFKSRISDIKDFSERIIRILSKTQEEFSDYTEDTIVCFEDALPSDILKIDKTFVKAVIMKNGSLYSHAAILLKAKSIPSIICPDFPMDEKMEGKDIITDGYSGKIFSEMEDEIQDKIVNELQGENIHIIQNKNSDAILTEIKQEISDRNEQTVLTENKQDASNSPVRKGNNNSFGICANISDISELDSAIENNADGIGLFRTEFIFIKSETLPTEEEQFKIYSETAKRMKGRKVIIRTIDIGSDKRCDCIKLPLEENPSMGLRGIRLCLKYPEIFKTQLRAILRASAYGKVCIMLPMITDLWEITETKKILEEIKTEFDIQNIDYDKNIELGIMVETPAAVMCADDLAKEADFFSVGTNDLTQYTFAIDRNNAIADRYYDSHHPAIMKMLKETADAAHKNGIEVSVCGELGADVNAIDELIEMGYDGVSVSCGMIRTIRNYIS
ncbi:MAG: phosphoenolpyruvate--protein phosphotransferase [Lachnospiraceae bacterium]|nr:phosphoenolpyruvate--protein phosphotransferase [Lachnospiraceae bacterium]